MFPFRSHPVSQIDAPQRKRNKMLKLSEIIVCISITATTSCLHYRRTSNYIEQSQYKLNGGNAFAFARKVTARKPFVRFFFVFHPWWSCYTQAHHRRAGHCGQIQHRYITLWCPPVVLVQTTCRYSSRKHIPPRACLLFFSPSSLSQNWQREIVGFGLSVGIFHHLHEHLHTYETLGYKWIMSLCRSERNRDVAHRRSVYPFIIVDY